MKKLFFIFTLYFSVPVWAGSYGLTIILLNIGNDDFQKSQVYENFIKMENSNNCWERLGNEITFLSHVTVIKKPDGIDKKLGGQIWNNESSAIKKAMEIMNYPKTNGVVSQYGPYDGLFVINPEESKLSIMAIGHWHSDSREMLGTSKMITVQLDKNPKKAALQFEKALCAAASYNVKKQR
jgi:hypothetical protein